MNVGMDRVRQRRSRTEWAASHSVGAIELMESEDNVCASLHRIAATVILPYCRKGSL